MLKKLLTTFIVLAATATAWAEGYGYTLDKEGARATITTGEQTLEEVITAIKGLTPTVQYVILPDGMTKEEVNSIATANGFVVAVSKNEATTTETKWVYTYNEEEFIYEGTPTTIDGVSKANVTVFVPLTVTESSYKLGDNDYNRTVFYDSDGNCYGVNNESDIFNLTTNGKGYTYNNGATEYTGKVAESEGKYYGVINNPTEVALELNKPVSWTYNLNYNNSITYAHFGEVYNNYGNNSFYQGGTEYPLTTEKRYTYDEYGQKKLYTGATRTADGITYGNTGTSFNVSYVKDAYTYNDNGIIKVYTGATRTADGITYGNTGEMIPLTTTTAAPWTYKDPNWPNPTCIYEGKYISGQENGNVGGTFYELTKVTATAENPVYTYYSSGIQYYYGGEVTYDSNTWPYYFGTVNEEKVGLTQSYTPGEYKYYTKDSKNIIYTGTVYTKLDGTDKYQYACEGGTSVVITKAEENVKYYTDTDNKKVVYTGNVYDKTTNEGTVKVGYTNSQEIPLEQKNVYVKDDNITVYPGNVYTKDGKSVGFENGGTEHQLNYGEVKLYTTKDGQILIATDNSRISLDGDTYCDGGTDIRLTNKGEDYTANLYTDGEGRSVIYTGKVYGDATGYIGGTETELAYGDIYKKEDGTIYTGYRNEENTMGCNNPQKLTTSFTYTYTNPNNGETVEYTDARHLTTKEVDYTTTVKQKEIEVPTGKIHLIAYVSTPGSLVDGISDWAEVTGTGYYKPSNVTALTLSGTVNAKDVLSNGNNVDQYGNAMFYENGEAKWNNSDSKAIGYDNPVALRQAPVTYIDLENAYFPVGTDMNFAFINNILQTVILPTHKDMTEIPEQAFNGLKEISELCIPYNYKKIGALAFTNTHNLAHIYTTDNPEDDGQKGNDDETIVDNGPGTYTFSANLEEIEGGGTSSDQSTFFSNKAEQVKDIYILAKKAPLCGPNSFSASNTYGWGGFNNTHPVCRENYVNTGNKWYTVLHFPSECIDSEVEKYTDRTRQYTLADETGAVDGKGKPFMWPKQEEYLAAWDNAKNGVIWDKETAIPDGYSGWHEFVLTGNSLARDYDPQTENTEFVYRDWLTICVPYDLKKSQVLSLLGVDPTKNANRKAGVIYEYVCSRDANGNPIKDSEGNYTFEYKEIKQTNAPLYPDVRALTHVSRSVKNGKMTLHFTKLIEQNEIAALSEGDNNETTVTTHDVAINESHGQGFTKTEQTEDDPVVMKGGHPYLIRAYVPKAWDDKIKNLGMYIMSAASSANHAAMEDGKELPYQYGTCTVQAGSVEMYLPCLKHKVHAFDADVKDDINSVVAKDQHTSFSYTDTSMDDPILYHFIGTYASTNIPQFAYYIGKTKDGVHKFSRTTKTTYTWAPYTAVIVGLSLPTYDTEHFGDKATGSADSFSNIIVRPGVKGDDLKIYVGEDEKLASSGARLSLGGFSDSTITGIVEIETDTVVRINDNKVYSINGQYMGTSLNNLPKGIYIINGQKKVVK